MTDVIKETYEDENGTEHKLHMDSTGVQFYVDNTGDHNWDVYEIHYDPYGAYHQLVGDVDDCDTEQEAADLWSELTVDIEL